MECECPADESIVDLKDQSSDTGKDPLTTEADESEPCMQWTYWADLSMMPSSAGAGRSLTY